MSLETIKPNLQIKHKPETCKLLISEKGAAIKVEVNTVSRGVIGSVQKVMLCKQAQEEFDVFCAVQMVSIGQLYGGKISAALDRQHPRDVFDVKLLFENEGLSDEIKYGFICSLISSDRPMHELLKPNLLDQQELFKAHFTGMTIDSFIYEDFEATRIELIKQVCTMLSAEDREFILAFNRMDPDWSRYPFEEFPSVK